jgi:hypothetical protein
LVVTFCFTLLVVCFCLASPLMLYKYISFRGAIATWQSQQA